MTLKAGNTDICCERRWKVFRSGRTAARGEECPHKVRLARTSAWCPHATNGAAIPTPIASLTVATLPAFTLALRWTRRSRWRSSEAELLELGEALASENSPLDVVRIGGGTEGASFPSRRGAQAYGMPPADAFARP